MPHASSRSHYVIRTGDAADAETLARLINMFNEEEGSPGRVGALQVEDLCGSPSSLYQAIVAVTEIEMVGYALTCRYFDTEPCVWQTYMQDLYVVPEGRSQGVGRQLMGFIARQALARDDHAIFWHVRDRNERGRCFYASVGSQEETAIPVLLKGQALRSLAENPSGEAGSSCCYRDARPD